MSCLEERVHAKYCDLVTDPSSLARRLLEGIGDRKIISMGTSGFGSVGYPKTFPKYLGDELALRNMKVIVLTGASAYGMDNVLYERGVVARRYPYQNNPRMRELINNGVVAFQDYHLGEWTIFNAPPIIRKYTGILDVAVIEASKIIDGGVIPTASIGAAPDWVKIAKSIIIEVNIDASPAIEGMHDIYLPLSGEPIPIRKVNDRVGKHFIEVPKSKILGIIESRGIDHGGEPAEPGPIEKGIAENLLEFLQEEIRLGGLPGNLYPIESGVGMINDAVFKTMREAGFKGLTAWTEVVQDSLIDLYHEGIMDYMSCTSLMLTPRNLENLYERPEEYKRSIILRPQSITNNVEVIRRLRVIAINTAVEVDIYGNVNSTHILGSRIINGIGGSGDFARGAYLSIFIAPSTRKNGRISSIVPMVTHVDTPDHDVDVLVTEQGVCDLRGLSPREKAILIIKRCAHPDYRDILLKYYEKAKEYGGHIPVSLEDAYKLHLALRDFGDMRLRS